MKAWNWSKRLIFGLVIGMAIAYVDNVAFAGEVSPIVIVFLLLAAAITLVGLWGQRGWISVGATWLCVPLVHLIKHMLGLPDTLNPNTYTSIFLLALFTLVVTALGAGAGLVVHKWRARAS